MMADPMKRATDVLHIYNDENNIPLKKPGPAPVNGEEVHYAKGQHLIVSTAHGRGSPPAAREAAL